MVLIIDGMMILKFIGIVAVFWTLTEIKEYFFPETDSDQDTYLP